MIIDIGATLGHYPFRKMAAVTAQEMIAQMDQWGIEHAVVSSLHAVFYRDAHRGNHELADAVREYPRRLSGVATLNPKYVGWQDDLEQALEQWQMKAVALFPAHHGYDLLDPLAQLAMDAIVKHQVPLVLTQRLEDRRQRHHWDVAEDLEFKTVLELGRRYPTLKIALCNWTGVDGQRMLDAGLKGRCLIDFARLHVLLHKDVPKLIELLGIEAIAFGSHWPFDYTAPSLVKLANLDTLGPADQQRVAGQNALEFFQLKF